MKLCNIEPMIYWITLQNIFNDAFSSIPIITHLSSYIMHMIFYILLLYLNKLIEETKKWYIWLNPFVLHGCIFNFLLKHIKIINIYTDTLMITYLTFYIYHQHIFSLCLMNCFHAPEVRVSHVLCTEKRKHYIHTYTYI